MPPFVIPNTVEVTLIWTLGGTDHAVNVLHYTISSEDVVDQTATDSLAAQIAIAFDFGATSYRDLVSNNYSLDRVGMRDLRTANLPMFTADIGLAGLAMADPLPQQSCYVITLRTALAGRRYRGRIYLPGWAEGQNDSNGNPVELVRTGAENFMTDMTTLTIVSGPLNLGVTSRVDEETRAVTSVQGRDLVWDTQRRRAYPGI